MNESQGFCSLPKQFLLTGRTIEAPPGWTLVFRHLYEGGGETRSLVLGYVRRGSQLGTR